MTATTAETRPVVTATSLVPFASLDWYHMTGRTIAALYQDVLGREVDPSGLLNLLWHAREHAWTAIEMRQFLLDSPEGHQRRAKDRTL